MGAEDMIFECPKCGSRNLTWSGPVTKCRDCGWSNEKPIEKIKRKLRRKRVGKFQEGFSLSLEA